MLDTAVDTRLDYERTVERSLVHRSAIAEVFVTDLHSIDADRFLAGAQLPLTHGYYNDHVHGQPDVFDLLLLLEACRQASTYGAHRQCGLALDTTMLVKNWSIQLAEARWPVAGPSPGELGLLDTVHCERDSSGDLSGLRFDLDLRFGGQALGRADIEVGCLTDKQYAALRQLQRGDRPPLSDELLASGALDQADRVPPDVVGRHNPANVVLADPQWTDRTLTARVAPRLDNRSLFDHNYDHLPAMVLMEAARQLSLLLVHSTASDQSTGDCAVTGFEASFERFAELDAPVLASTTVPDDPAPGLPRAGITFEQSGRTIARCVVHLGEPAAAGTADQQGGNR
jgi:hypothetical protein